jgi:hypothetical protein
MSACRGWSAFTQSGHFCFGSAREIQRAPALQITNIFELQKRKFLLPDK